MARLCQALPVMDFYAIQEESKALRAVPGFAPVLKAILLSEYDEAAGMITKITATTK
jgi:hypothetical protein